jgi:hypothetical protein
VNWKGDGNAISHACRVAGCYTISAGPSSPTMVLDRLLDALRILAPDTHRVITEPGGEYASVPPEALRDGLNPWWGTEDADSLLKLLFASINAAAPEGFACMLAEGDRIAIERIEPESTAEEDRSRPPPQFSAVRARVRPPQQ